MSEDGGRGADRRTPRFSWNQSYEATFFRSLCESIQLGFKENHSFKAGAWERAAIALRDKHSAYPEKSHLINKADNARKKFRMWRGLREDPEFLYNPSTRMVTASEEAWQRHFEKEPLSKALRGRPFDHEEYMEILFPDVIGSGGAPKRVMKKRKGTDGTPIDTPSSSSHQVMDLAIEPTLYSQTPTQPPSHTPGNAQPMTLPTTATTTVVTPIALTPPDETTSSGSSRKRPAQEMERRRGRPSRFSSNLYSNGPEAAAPVAVQPPPAPAAPRPQPIHPSFNSAALFEDGLLMLADALKARSPPRWPEQAMEILFRDFADEDADLQLKIAEKVFTDENKAMVFVKATPELRRHYVGKLREVHYRGFPVGLGRVGDEAS